MKVYQAVSNPYASVNQYVMTLMNGIDAQFDDVEWGWGADTFWQDKIFEYDAIHIQWPDILLWQNHTPRQIEYRLSKLKENGKKIISTCHNLEPHYCSDINKKEVYNIVYGNSDMMLHLGSYSLDFMRERFPKVNHVLLPHQVYDAFYTFLPDKYDSCKKLNLSLKNKYIICYGAFRDAEERNLSMCVAKTYQKTNVYVLAPSYDTRWFCKISKPFEHLIKNKLFNLRRHIVCHGYANNTIPNDLTPYYYGASDLALVQRKKILNSGNVTLAFLMGKVVVGPDVGNVGLLLRETGNPTFDVNDDSTIIAAVRKGFELVKENYGEKNRRYAMDNFSTAIISKRLYNYYLTLINDVK